MILETFIDFIFLTSLLFDRLDVPSKSCFQIVGNDLLMSNTKRIEKAIAESACDLLLKILEKVAFQEDKDHKLQS
ncbi:uncharacterized protein [Phaseolus vulgaris]|uniref:uncharacterized protein isoform X2 n=1 Tax=Phaseolus vulgaris TaxID=3885 RepID=UPI0035C99A08